MCHLASHRASPASDATEEAGPPLRALRPRWLVGVAAVALAGLAAATLLDRSAIPAPPLATTSAGQPADVASTFVPVTAPATRNTLLPDDDVPTTTGSSKPMLGHCDHGA